MDLEFGLEGEGGQDIWPNWVIGIRRIRNDPEALPWMVNDGDSFCRGGSNWPSVAQKVQGEIGIEAALSIESQVQIQQWR